MKNIQLLDCTLRDGGSGLEDAFYKNLADLKFSMKDSGLESFMNRREEEFTVLALLKKFVIIIYVSTTQLIIFSLKP